MRSAQKSLCSILQDTQWVQLLPQLSQERIFDEATEAWFKAGDTVAPKGELSSSWIGVATGLLKISAVYKTGKVVIFTGIPEGSWVGEGSVLKREPRRYDIIAMRDSRVIHVPGSTVRWLLDTSFEFNHYIISRLNERLAQYIGMVEIDRISDPLAKTARAIANLFNPVLYPLMGPYLGLSQSELGELVGISRATINPALKQLEAEGYISTEYGGIVVKDVAGLRTYEERESGKGADSRP